MFVSTVLDCQSGEMADGQKCTKCPRGMYQPDRGKTTCIDCPPNTTTESVGSSDVADCLCKLTCCCKVNYFDFTTTTAAVLLLVSAQLLLLFTHTTRFQYVRVQILCRHTI